MPADKPEQVFELLRDTINRGDVDGALALYEPRAMLVDSAGEPAAGLEALRRALAAMVRAQLVMSGKVLRTFEVDGIALVLCDWAAFGTAPDGEALQFAGLSTDVLRRQPDGAWLSIIDNPFGTSPPPRACNSLTR
jgi:ketosteroid isomerase-like protein